MKKFLCVFLSALMLLSVMALASCGKDPADNDGKESASESVAASALKFGLGIKVSAPEATSATADVNGQGTVDITAAVLTVDADGKVVAAQIDTMANTVAFTKDGKAIANTEFKTKYEQGFDYGMVNYQVSEKEWFEQVDAFEKAIVGKTLAEIKALVVEGYKPNTDLQTAGCTVAIADFVGAVEKAFANLADSTATASSTLKLGMSTVQETADATADTAGSNSVETTIFAAAVDAEGKVLAADTDCVAVDFTFDVNGVSTLDTTKAISSKRELGFNYNMVNYHASEKEWFQHADIFETLCLGKTAAEIVALGASDNYGTDAVKTAGCTIKVDGFTKAAAKLG